MRRFIATLVLVCALLGAGIAWFISSGIYDVRVSSRDRPELYRLMDVARSRSVRRSAAEERPLRWLDGPTWVRAGADYYQRLCADCHGSPGAPPGELAQGLLPAPPPLDQGVTEWTRAEVYWTIKNGIKFTAMPGWGRAYGEEELQAITAFLEKLPSLSPESYRELRSGPASPPESARRRTLHQADP